MFVERVLQMRFSTLILLTFLFLILPKSLTIIIIIVQTTVAHKALFFTVH